MLINNVDIKSYDAVLVSFCYTSPHMTVELLSTGMNHIKKELALKPKPMELKLVFQSDSKVGNFISQLLDQVIIDTEDGYLYDCLLSQAPNVVHLGLQIYEVTFTFSTIKKKPLITLINPNVANIQGDYDAPCIYEITPISDLPLLTIDGYRLQNLKANDTFVLDGINKLVYRKSKLDLSAFSDTNLTKFPILKVGAHTFSASIAVNFTVKYYPIFL